MLVVTDWVKTMAQRAHNTLDGHPEVKELHSHFLVGSSQATPLNTWHTRTLTKLVFRFYTYRDQSTITIEVATRRCHASQRLPDVILCRSFTRPSTMLAVIEGLGTRLYSLSVHLRVDNLYWVDKFHVYMWFHSAIWLVPPDLGTGSPQLLQALFSVFS